jgi:oleate hydratase
VNIYSTFYHAPKPKGIEQRKAYIVGGGIAGLAAAAFIVDDAGMPGENVTIFEKRYDVGGCCGVIGKDSAYVCPGEREMEPYMECLWYLCSKIPSLDTPGRTVLDETVDANKDNPIHSECRALQNQGHIWEGIHNYKMDRKTTARLQAFLVEPEENLENLTIEDYFGKGSPYFDSAMWWCFHTMLAFKPYHSALEAKRYLSRFGLANRIDYLEGILHCKRNEYNSIIKPLMVWLKEKGVKIFYGSAVYDLDMDKDCNTVHSIRMRSNGEENVVAVGTEDYVFITNGSMMTKARFGDNTHIAETVRNTSDLGLFTIWQNLAKRNEKFGHPEKFLGQIDKTKWMSYLVTVKDYPQFFERLEQLTGSKAGTGGAITMKDSGWEISLVLYDRDYFPNQRANNEDVLWGDGLFGERIGDYIKKPMDQCTGEEILAEILYHFNLMDMKDEVLAHAHVSTCMMPYITSQFMPRTATDRPRIVPEGCTNLAFIGQFVEVPGDVVFTIETSVRTPLEAVYQLTGLDKDILEVYPSQYDIRYFVERMKMMAGIKGEITEDVLPKISLLALPKLKKKLIARINSIPSYYVMYPGRDRSVSNKEAVLNPQYPKEP